jgi:proteic killer suppression protein
MIASFADRDTERLFNRERVRRFPSTLHGVMRRKLLLLDAVLALEELRVPPGNRLEKLRGERAGRHSIRVNQQWRVCFRWRDGAAFAVEIVDYH